MACGLAQIRRVSNAKVAPGDCEVSTPGKAVKRLELDGRADSPLRALEFGPLLLNSLAEANPQGW